MEYDIVVGIEIHVELKTATKMFSGAPYAFKKPANTCDSVIDLAHPGTLPCVNKEAVRKAIEACTALNLEIDPLIRFFGREDAQVLEYWYDNSMYSNWTKPPKRFTPDEDTVFRDIAFYRQKGFVSIASFGCFLGPDYEELYGEPDLTAFQKALSE